MMNFPAASLLFASLMLSACSLMPPMPFSKGKEASVVYALGSRDGFLRLACPAFEFKGSQIALADAHEQQLEKLAEEWKKEPKTRYLIAGYTPPDLPEDHARALSERRTLGLRQRLIELGVEGANIQTLGLGNDFSQTSPATHVALVYKQ
jgi:outer membrane protein OmpA-like peptidoglycan-associated protein